MSYTKFSGILLVVLLLASGCVKVGPDFVKPEADTMPQWLEAEGYKQVTTKADDYRDWWRSFNDPVLDKLIQTAYQQNLTLAHCRGAGPGGPGPTGRRRGLALSPKPKRRRLAAKRAPQ